MKLRPEKKKPRFLLFENFQFTDSIAVSICFLSLIFWVSILAYKYSYFGYYDWDLALSAQTIWNIAHGSLDVSLIGAVFLANHSYYIAFLLAPIYFLFQSPFTLISLKIISYLLAALIIYQLSKKELNPTLGIFLMILYLSFPPNIFGNLFEYDFESTAMVLICLSFYFLVRGKLIPFLISLTILALVKENMPLLTITFGIYALITKKNKKLLWGIIPILIGSTIFYSELFIITPYFRKNFPITVPYVGLYQELGGTWIEIAQNMLLKPYKLLSSPLSHPMNLYYFRDLFGPFLLLVFFSPGIMLMGAPLILQSLLSNSLNQHTIYFHYTQSIAPFIFLSVIYALKFFKNRYEPFLFNFIVIIIFSMGFANTLSFHKKYKQHLDVWKDPQDPVRWEMLRRVPEGASIVSTFNFLPELTNRKHLYSFHNVWRGINQLTVEAPYRIPAPLEYILIDFKDPWVMGETTENVTATTRLKEFFGSSDWRIESANEDIVLLRSDPDKTGTPLVHYGRGFTTPLKNVSQINVDNKFSLEAVQIAKNRTSLSLIFQWKAYEDISQNYQLALVLQYTDGRIERKDRQIGYLIYPPYLWKKGDHVEERYFLSPSFPEFDFSLQMAIYNTTTGEIARLESDKIFVKDNIVSLKSLIKRN